MSGRGRKNSGNRGRSRITLRDTAYGIEKKESIIGHFKKEGDTGQVEHCVGTRERLWRVIRKEQGR